MSLSVAKIKELQEATGHSVFSPSSMKRIILCPASVAMELKAPVPETSEFAAKGTLLHEYCELVLSTAMENPMMFINEQKWEDDDKVLVIDAINYVLRIMEKHVGEATVTLEAKGSLSEWGMPEIYGTMDVKIESEARLDVLDYKFGFGIQVFATGNPQCGIYLASGIPFGDGSIPDKKLFVHIVQPPLNHYDEWEVDWGTLVSLILTDVGNAVKVAKSKDPEFNPSMEACRWCNARMFCDVRIESNRKKAELIAEASKDPRSIAKAQWKKLLDAADDIGQAIKDIRIFAQAEIRSGRGFPGYKLVAGRSKRVFKDKKAGDAYIVEIIGEEKAYAPKTTITLAAAEKIKPGLKKNKDWKDMITKPDGKPVLAPDSDKRAGLTYGVESDFTEDAAEMAEIPEVTSPFDS